MLRPRSPSTGFARALAALALLAMAVRALVPAGYMPTPAEGGRFLAVAMCNGQGADAIIDLETGAIPPSRDHDGKQPDGSHGPCVFVAVAQLATPEATPAFVRVPTIYQFAPEPSAPPTRAAALAAPPPWATGPPLLP